MDNPYQVATSAVDGANEAENPRCILRARVGPKWFEGVAERLLNGLPARQGRCWYWRAERPFRLQAAAGIDDEIGLGYATGFAGLQENLQERLRSETPQSLDGIGVEVHIAGGEPPAAEPAAARSPELILGDIGVDPRPSRPLKLLWQLSEPKGALPLRKGGRENRSEASSGRVVVGERFIEGRKVRPCGRYGLGQGGSRCRGAAFLC